MELYVKPKPRFSQFFLKCTDKIRMSVKGVSPSAIYEIQSLNNKKSESASTHKDKDPNGQMTSGGGHEKKKFTEEDVKEAVEKMKKLEGIKANHLSIKYEKKGYIYVVYVMDMTGKVVRRIPEQDLVLYLKQDEAKASGHILNKAM